MKRIQKKKNKRLGQSTVEYLLIIVAVVAALSLFGSKFKEKVGQMTDSLFGNINKTIDQSTK